MSDLMLHEKERRLLTCYIFLMRTRRNIQILLVSKLYQNFMKRKSQNLAIRNYGVENMTRGVKVPVCYRLSPLENVCS